MSYKLVSLLLSICFVLFFWTPLNSFFSQDDFYHLRQIMSLRISDLPTVFIPAYSSEQTFYRPISRELLNFVFFSLFDLNPLVFHILNAIIILLIARNIFLLLKSLKLVSASLAACTIYIFSSIHSVELYYLPSVQTLLATLFGLMGIRRYISNGNSIDKTSTLFFGTAVLSHESALVLVPILIWHKILFSFKNEFKYLFGLIVIGFWPLWLIVGIRMLLTMVSGLPNQLAYQPNFSLASVFGVMGWMVLWSLNFSEILPDFMGFFWIQNKNIFVWYQTYFIMFVSSVVILTSLLFACVIKSWRYLYNNKYLWWFIGSYSVSMLPFVFFPAHKFSYYLSFSVVWLAMGMGLLFGRLWNMGSVWRVVSIITVVVFIIGSKLTTDLNHKTHWAAKRAVSAKFLLKDIKTKYPNVPKGQVFLIIDDPSYPYISKEWGSSSKQAFFILSGQDAFQLAYGDSTIRVYFEGLGGLPSGEDSKKLIIYRPVFPY